MRALIAILAFLIVGALAAQDVTLPLDSIPATVPVAAQIYGREVFIKSRCIACHSNTAQQINVSNAKSKSLDVLTFADTMLIKQYLRKEIEKFGKKHPVAFKNSPEELDTLSLWLIKSQTIPVK